MVITPPFLNHSIVPQYLHLQKPSLISLLAVLHTHRPYQLTSPLPLIHKNFDFIDFIWYPLNDMQAVRIWVDTHPSRCTQDQLPTQRILNQMKDRRSERTFFTRSFIIFKDVSRIAGAPNTFTFLMAMLCTPAFCFFITGMDWKKVHVHNNLYFLMD